MNSKRVGNIGEACILAEFVNMQIPVYLPFGDLERADLIADFNGKLNKIQIKTCEKFEDGQFEVSLKSSTIRHGKDYYHTYDESEIDYFAVYNIPTKIALLLPISEFSGRTSVKINVPYKESRNQYKNVNWEDYTFNKIISVETLHEES